MNATKDSKMNLTSVVSSFSGRVIFCFICALKHKNYKKTNTATIFRALAKLSIVSTRQDLMFALLSLRTFACFLNLARESKHTPISSLGCREYFD